MQNRDYFLEESEKIKKYVINIKKKKIKDSKKSYYVRLIVWLKLKLF